MPDMFVRSKPTLTAAGAKIALVAAEVEAARLGVEVSIAVVDAAGNLLSFARTDDAMLVTVDAAIAKARTAAQTRLPTRALQELVDTVQPSLLAVHQLMPATGGYPANIGPTVVGGVGASGAALDEDEAVARAGAEAIGRAEVN